MIHVELGDPTVPGGPAPFFPQIVCDLCCERIFRTGKAVWLLLENGDTHPNMWHVHDECANEYFEILGERLGGAVYAQDLECWFANLLYLSYIEPSDLARRLEGLKR
jgi:hypothetical protein